MAALRKEGTCTPLTLNVCLTWYIDVISFCYNTNERYQHCAFLLPDVQCLLKVILC